MSKTETLVKNKIDTSLIEERNYKVVFYNDDLTPFDFVASLIQLVFEKAPGEAFYLTLRVHEDGSAVVETYKNKSIAQTKVDYCISLARSNGYPLVVKVEE